MAYDNVPFARLKFKGDRFDGASMPVETLVELEAYRDIIVAAAKLLFLQQNQSRKRSPAGLGAMSLVLTGIDEGSAVPTLAIVAGLMAPDAFALFEESRGLIETIVERAPHSDAALPDIAYSLAPHFRKMGDTLHDGEHIFLRGAAAGSDNDAVRFDPELRDRLLDRLGDESEERWADVRLFGEVIAANRTKRKFTFVGDAGTVDFTLGEDHARFRTLFDWTRDSQLVMIEGRARYLGKRLQTVEVERVSKADVDLDNLVGCSMPLRTQLDDLAALEVGWLNGDGGPYAQALLDTVYTLVAHLMDEHGLPTPFVYPTGDGDVRIEWPSPRWEVVLRFSSDASTVSMVACEVGTDGFIEDDLAAALSPDFDELGRRLVEFLQQVPT